MPRQKRQSRLSPRPTHISVFLSKVWRQPNAVEGPRAVRISRNSDMHFHHAPVTPDTCRDSHLSPKRSGLAEVPLLSQLVILIAAKDPLTPAAASSQYYPPVARW